jgi:phage gp37-like protein
MKTYTTEKRANGWHVIEITPAGKTVEFLGKTETVTDHRSVSRWQFRSDAVRDCRERNEREQSSAAARRERARERHWRSTGVSAETVQWMKDRDML